MKPDFFEQDSKIIAQTYAKAPAFFAKGRGVRLFDSKGKEYLDFASGISVNALGHCNSAVVKAIREQSEKFLHISNLYPNEPQIKLAQKMLSLTKFGKENGKAFFCNSGTEANEAAIKFARKYFSVKAESKRMEIITFQNSFHGRTYGALAATGQEKLRAGFGPMPADFKYVEWNNAEQLKNAVCKNTAAIMLEPIVAEGGILMPSKKFIKTINELKKQSGCLVIADEIQAGFGRCGEISCSELFGINADIVTWAKALGGGLPLGMVLMRASIAECLKPGDHGTTFGGNPVACAAGLASLELISKPKFLANVKERSAQLKAGLETLAKKYAWLGNVRGEGLLLGIESEKPVANIIAACREHGLLILRAGTNVLRLLPPLIITKNDAKEALQKLDKAFISN
ncbi:MAG: aspartate aminotransferase family protein [Fibromonadaceae bacterium]|jgi:predicted acetylornithine/succinylornithine family transaminase|nr:aspartate aminotransferase family protein [Fibromonadaceae bacterium]